MLIHPRHAARTIVLLALIAGSACGPRGSRSSVAVAHAEALAATMRVDHLDTLAREPMLVEHPGGTLFVTGYNRVRPMLWRSRDRGASWQRVEVGTAAEGAVGNSDVDLAVAPDGTLYFAVMTFDNQVYEGRRIAVGVSRDTGATWRWSTVSSTRFDDRPWITVAPDGVAHLVWNDDRGVRHARSGDRGASWTPTGRVHERGGSSHLVVGPRGELAVRVTPGAASGNQCHPGTELVMVSVDAGTSWQARAAPGVPRAAGCPGADEGEIPRWVDPLAWDAAGNLYALWTDSSGVWLGRSRDRASTWRSWRIDLRAPGEPVAYYPYLAARGAGELAATWFVKTADPRSWRVALLDARGETPRVRRSAPLSLESWRGDPRRADEGGEYLAVRFLRDGDAAVVTPIQNASGGRLGFTWWRFGDR